MTDITQIPCPRCGSPVLIYKRDDEDPKCEACGHVLEQEHRGPAPGTTAIEALRQSREDDRASEERSRVVLEVALAQLKIRAQAYANAQAAALIASGADWLDKDA